MRQPRFVEQLSHQMKQRVRTGSQSTDRAAQLLTLVLENGEPITVGELAATTGLPKSTVSRLLGSLERHGLLQRLGERSPYRAGPVLHRFARRDVVGADLEELARPMLAALSAETGETVNLSVPHGNGFEIIVQLDSRHLLGTPNWVGRNVALHASAVGKLLVAFGAVEFDATRLPRLGPRTICERPEFDRELERIRATDVAIAIDELEPGLATVAVPVRDGSSRVAATISITGPSFRLDRGLIDTLIPSLRRHAAVLSKSLGYDPPMEGAS